MSPLLLHNKRGDVAEAILHSPAPSTMKNGEQAIEKKKNTVAAGLPLRVAFSRKPGALNFVPPIGKVSHEMSHSAAATFARPEGPRT